MAKFKILRIRVLNVYGCFPWNYSDGFWILVGSNTNYVSFAGEADYHWTISSVRVYKSKVGSGSTAFGCIRNWCNKRGQVPWHNGMLQNGHITKRYVLQNGTLYKTVCVTKRYALQNGTRYKTVTLQNGTCYTTVRYKTVTVIERYVTKRYTLHNGTFFILRYEGTNPWISWAFALT
jgi:hypothetical protein